MDECGLLIWPSWDLAQAKGRICANWGVGISASYTADHKETWALKNGCFWTVVLEKTLESPLGCEEIQSVHLKGNQPWIFIGRTDVEAEAPVLWLPDAKSRFFGKDSDAGKDWGQEEKGETDNEIVRWNHWLNAHEFEQTLGDSEGQGSLACFSPWGRKESDTTEWLNNNTVICQHHSWQESPGWDQHAGSWQC